MENGRLAALVKRLKSLIDERVESLVNLNDGLRWEANKHLIDHVVLIDFILYDSDSISDELPKLMLHPAIRH